MQFFCTFPHSLWKCWIFLDWPNAVHLKYQGYSFLHCGIPSKTFPFGKLLPSPFDQNPLPPLIFVSNFSFISGLSLISFRTKQIAKKVGSSSPNSVPLPQSEKPSFPFFSSQHMKKQQSKNVLTVLIKMRFIGDDNERQKPRQLS